MSLVTMSGRVSSCECNNPSMATRGHVPHKATMSAWQAALNHSWDIYWTKMIPMTFKNIHSIFNSIYSNVYHHSDVLTSMMASQITGILIVCSWRRSKKISKLHIIGLCEENSPVTTEFPAQRASTLQWHHNEPSGISNYQPHNCLLNRLFRGRSKKHQSSASLAFVWGIHRWSVNSLHKGPVMLKMFPFDDVIMNAANIFIWWCHHVL